MIKKITLALAAIFLLASCANKFSVVKRKYNKGYHFAVSKNPASSQKNEVVKNTTLKPANVNSLPVEPVEAEIITKGEAGIATLTVSTPELKTTAYLPQSVKENKEAVTASAKNEKTGLIKPIKEIQAAQKSSAAAKGGTSEGNLILLVILSLFPILALIAMYIHDGHKVTTNFWVDLILHLTFIGYIIYALLVVFDVVDLS